MTLPRLSSPVDAATSSSPAPSTTRSRSRSRSQPSYAALAPHNINVSRSKILKKWKPLPQSTQDRIRAVLSEVKTESKARRQKALPRSVNGKNITKDILSEEEWEAVVDEVVEKLISRLPRMPFPPSKTSKSSTSTSTTHPTSNAATDLSLSFSLDPSLIRISHLRSTLSSTQQSNKLLKAQITREENALKRDRNELKTLEEGVKRSRESSARQAKSLHTITQSLDESDIHNSQVGIDLMSAHQDDTEIMLDALVPTAARSRSKRKHVSLTTSAIEGDAELAPLAKQLRSHLSSMQSNVASLQSVQRDIDSVEDSIVRFTSRA